MRKTETHHTRDFLIGAVIGSALGTLTTCMFTTKKGHEIHKKMARKYHDFEHAMKGFVKENVIKKIGTRSGKYKAKRKR
ncbi:MAG TPA: YtxH domain-containing protein [Rhabdochlamydiaceae bacterium]|nr:YtxH domain-containing protein [Rhabdochlamydiaceae bacterium]